MDTHNVQHYVTTARPGTALSDQGQRAGTQLIIAVEKAPSCVRVPAMPGGIGETRRLPTTCRATRIDSALLGPNPGGPITSTPGLRRCRYGRSRRFRPCARLPDYERVCVAGVRLIMSLSCWICGSGSAWEDGWLVSEGEQGEGDERFGSVEAECDSGEESDLGVGRLDEGVGEP